MKIKDDYSDLDDIKIGDKDKLEALEKIFEDPVIRTYFQARRANLRNKIIKLTNFATEQKPKNANLVTAYNGMLHFVDKLLEISEAAWRSKQRK